MSRRIFPLALALFLLPWDLGGAQDKKLEPLRVAYTSVTGTRAPLWIAKDNGIFEKYGLDVNLIVIAAGNTAISALVAGDVQVTAVAAVNAMYPAARGIPVVIIGTFGPLAYKLVAHPSITSVEGLKGKVIGSSRPGTITDFAISRALAKLGLVPGKDVKIIPTGLGESNKRIMVMLQGKIDATLVTEDNIGEIESRGLKVSLLADLKELGVRTSISDLVTTRSFAKSERSRVKAFLMAFSEATWLGKTNKEVALKAYRKHMRVDDPKMLESMYKNYIQDSLLPKPYPMEDAIQADIESLAETQPEFKGKRPPDFMDNSILRELDQEGFFARLYR